MRRVTTLVAAGIVTVSCSGSADSHVDTPQELSPADRSREGAAHDRGRLVFSTYFMADEIERYLATDEAIDDVIRLCGEQGIPRIYLETFRNGKQATREMIAHARDRLRDAGFDVAAAICTTRYGEPGTVLTHFPCLTKKASQEALEDIFTFAASLFDTILIDEYIWSHCQCDQCQAEKGNRTWTEFRCDQLRQVLRDHAIAPSRKIRPDIQLIYKFPAMYEQFSRQGQDIDYMLKEFDGIWIGTEVGPFTESPQNLLRTQGPYRAFFLTRWMNEMGGGRLGGSWIMPLQDTNHLLDTTYQTVLGAPREIVLHPYGGISPNYRWGFPGGEGQFQIILNDSAEISKLASIVNENRVRGLVAARPNRAEPWDFGTAYDANVFDYIGQVGIPLRPTRDFPGDAEGFFLSLHTRSFPDYDEKIKSLRDSSVPILMTDGLAATLDQEFIDKPNVFVIQGSVSNPSVFDYRGFADPYDMANQLSAITGEEAWEALRSDVGWDTSMKYMGDGQMAAKVFGMQLSLPEMIKRRFRQTGQRPQRNVLPLEELRAEMLRPFGITFRGPILVSVHPYGEDYLVLHNFNGHSVNVWLEAHGKSEIEPVLTLPTTSKSNHTKTDNGFQIDIDPHTLACFKLSG